MSVTPAPPSPNEPGSTTWLLKGVTAAYDAPTLHESLQRIVDLFCELTQWPVGHAVTLSPDAEPGIWCVADADRYATFVRATTELDREPAFGIRAQVIDLARPLWVTDFVEDHAYPRAALARDLGLRTCLVVPVVSSQGIEALFEFFHEQSLPRNLDLLNAVFHFGTQIGVRLDARRTQQSLVASEQRLLEAQTLARIGSWTWDVDADVVNWSPQMYLMHGLDPSSGDVTTEMTVELIHPDHRAQVSTAVMGTVESLAPYEHDYRIQLPSGEVRWMHARGEVLEQADGVATRVGGYCQDVSEQRLLRAGQQLAERELSNHHRVLEQIARGLPLAHTLERVCADVEQGFPGARCTVLLADTAVGVLRRGAAPSLPAAFIRALDGLPITEGAGACGTAAFRRETTIVHDTQEDPLTEDFTELAKTFGLRSVWSQPLVSPSGEVLGAFAVYRSQPHTPHPAEVQAVTVAASLAALAIERDRSESALKRAAAVDELTGLPNRRRFLEQLDQWLTRDVRIAVLFMDLDRFNWINDSLGHEAGDRILAQAALRLQRALGDDGFVARFGGDEFTALIPHATEELIEQLVDAVEQAFLLPFVLEDGEFFLSTSTGIALNDYPVTGSDLVRDADSAMYAAKDSGRARRAMFDEGMRERAIARLALENELRRALEGNELVLHYQPILDLRSGQVPAVEALVRWDHPTRGPLQPQDFIPLAEETGLIVPLGAAVLDLAIADAAAWTAKGLRTRLTVNVSAIQLADPGFGAAVASCLARHGLPANRLLLEVTESAVMERIEQARTALDKVVALGVQVLIDDFGTGYSSIARLGDLPVVGLKVDRRFTVALGSSAAADGLFAAINGLATALSLDLVVEGIEDAAMLELVQAQGGIYGQGYHLARPLPLPELVDLLVERADRTDAT
jgi:c-di-GMP-specific phosphodiesterase